MSRAADFSIEEDAYIRSSYEHLSDKEISEVLGRPVGSITRRRQRLGCWAIQQKVFESFKDEVWKQITELPEGYMVSNKGRVKSGEKLCSLKVRKNGYVQWRLVNLSKDLFYTFKVHRLVAEHFCDIEGDSDDFHVHHKDHNSGNNSSCNLEWLSPEDHRAKHKKLKLMQQGF